ncbi:MAG: DUF3187 family protein [Halioglobus sp.]|nr:DUF3187 family protein [Halioglobus sp.]
MRGFKGFDRVSKIHVRPTGIVFLGVLGALPALASEPLYVKNLSPVAGLIGLPSQRAAQTTPDGEWAVALHGSLASHYVNENNATEFLNFDGETGRVALELRYGVAENWDVQLEVPWLEQSGGDLDGLIDDWHDFWGMSDGGRSQVPRDVLDYRYASSQGGFSLQDDTSGIGDVSLSVSHAFYRDENSAVSAVLGYKFGTGDDKDFLGSGGDDAFVALRFSGEQLSDLPLSWHGQVGYLRAGDSDVLEGLQEQNLWFAGLAMDWRFAQNWSMIAQIDSHAAPLDSALTGVGDDAVMGTLGARWYFAPHWSVDFSVVEDIRVETAPDVTFQASVRYRSADQ